MKDTKFYICQICGNLIQKIHDSGVTPVCCAQKMTELVAGTTEASREKHIPVIETAQNTVTVTVGSVIHPMTKEHSILWITLITDKGVYRKELSQADEPVAIFTLTGEKAICAYAYCNLHGLWKAEI